LNGLCANTKGFDKNSNKIFNGLNKTADGLFRGGGNNGLAAFLFAENIRTRDRGGVYHVNRDVAVVHVRHVPKERYAA
jgi:hypothetical protein